MKKLVIHCNDVYEILYKLPLTKRKITEVRTRLYKINLWDEKYLRYKAVIKYLQSFFVFAICTVLSIAYFNNNLYVMFTLIFFSFQIKNLILDWTIGNDTNLLIGLIDYVDALIKEFSYAKNVLKSMKSAKEINTNYIAVAYVEKTIIAINDKKKFDKYIEKDCHNEFLKLLSICCFLTNEYGDTINSDKKSDFIENLKYIKDLMGIELSKRRDLKYWIKGLSLRCLIPLLAFVPYEMWVTSLFTMVQGFYETSSAFLLKIGITIISLTCFYIAKRYEKTELESIVYKKTTWEMRLLKIKPLAKLVKAIMPKKESKRSYKYRDLISKSGISTKLEYLYLRRILFGVGAFFITILITISVNKINYSNILNDNTTMFKNDIITASGKQVDSKEIENEILKDLNSNNIDENKDTASKLLMQKGIVDQATVKSISQKIADKKEALASQTEKWWEIVLSIVVGISATFIPEFFIRLQINIRQLAMDLEIILFETIILVLIPHGNCTVELMLEYMSKFSVIFKNYIEIIINKIKKRNYDEIEKLLIEINYKEFTDIIKSIMRAEDIGIKEAFATLSSNRMSALEDKRKDYEKLIDLRKEKSKFVCSIPYGAFVGAYILIPVIMIAFIQIIDIKNKVDNLY